MFFKFFFEIYSNHIIIFIIIIKKRIIKWLSNKIKKHYKYINIMSFLVSDPSLHSEITSFQDLIHNEKIRFSKKASSIFTALMIIVLAYGIFPKLFLPIYVMLPYENKAIMYVGGIMIVTAIMYSITELSLYIIYKYKIPYFEYYRVDSKEPWPWEKNLEEYKIHHKKTLKYILFNNAVLLPIALCLQGF